MLRRLFLCALLVCLQLPVLGAEWLLLKDGRVGRGDPSSDPMEVTLRGGRREKVPREQLAASRSDREIQTVVDGALEAIISEDRVEAHSKVLKDLKHAAVPRLVHHLREGDVRHRAAALCALDLCWSSSAVRPVLERLGDTERKVKDAAVALVRNKVSRKQIDAVLPALLDEKNWPAAVPAFELAEQRRPEVRRVRRVMALPQFQKVAERYLPRYSAPELTPVTLGLLAGEDLSARRAAVISLIHQNDDSAETRARVAGLLADASPVMREAAGEYLLWHGTEAESESLQAAARKEADLHARASMLAAAAVIRRRAKRPAAKPPSGEKKNPPPPRSFADAWLLLRAHPSDAIRAQALDVYRRREEFEPRLRYAGGDPDAKLSRERTARMLLAAEIFAFPANARSRDASRPEDVPVAASFTAPVRDYFHPGRRSFGLHTAPGGRAFGNSVHVGDDVSWLKDQTTVVAIADGVVRRVNQVWTWGFIVIVEHRLPGEDAWCCSLYAHLSPAVCVAPGDVVRKGQKIGSTGRSLCWENGGYWSHLHFGLHDGPYLSSHPIGRKIDYTLSSGEEVVGVVTARGDPCATVTVTHKGESVSFEVAQSADWICGYVSKDFWKGEHGWLDPQKFIRERLDDTERPAVERRIRELEAESKKKKEDGKSAPAPEPGKKAA